MGAVGRAGLSRVALTRRAAGGIVRTAAAGAVLATAHTVVNLKLLRVPPSDPPPARGRVSVLLPVRDEAHRVAPCVTALLAQRDVPELEILVLDDGSTDRTWEVVREVAEGDPRLRLLAGAPLPPGWLGKPHACAQLAEAASGATLVFVDADVLLAPTAIAATVSLLREDDLDLVCPYPRQIAETALERLVQPLLQWSWLTFLPLRIAESSRRPSLVAANGQLLACDAVSYGAAGGHRAVGDAVIEDMELAKAFKRNGFRVAMADGTDIARCRMYLSARELREGYAKSLWAAFGSPTGAIAACALLSLLYVVPPVAVIFGREATRRAGMVGFATGMAGRVLVARRVGSRTWPDAAGHPLSITILVAMTADSIRRHRSGRLTWKGRTL